MSQFQWNKTFWLSCLLFFLAPGSVFAASRPMEAKAVYVKGKAQVIRSAGAKPSEIVTGTVFAVDDRIFTSTDGVVEVKFGTGDLIRIDSNTDISISALHYDDRGSTFNIFNMALGRVKNAVSKLATSDSKFEYRTRAAIAGVSGSPDWVVEAKVDPSSGKDMTSVYFLGQPGEKGSLYIIGMEGTVLKLTPGTQSSVLAGQPPVPSATITPDRRRQMENGMPFINRGDNASLIPAQPDVSSIPARLVTTSLAGMVSTSFYPSPAHVNSPANSIEINNLETRFLQGSKSGDCAGAGGGQGVVPEATSTIRINWR